MNPLSLTLKNFIGIRSGLGRDEVTIDLTMPGDLIAIVGPNGAGKTTILDNLHPYRVMPSRAAGYSPGQFSYYEHVYGTAVKRLLWEHEGETYESSNIIKAANKTKTQECYLHRVRVGGALEPVEFPDGLISDGKTATYDNCVERILGSPELFFTAVFACQGRRTLDDYGAGDIKSFMADLLGLESIQALGQQANDVRRALGAKLEAVRGRTARAAVVRSEIAQAESDLTGAQTTATMLGQQQIAGRTRLRDTQRRLVEAQAAAADQAATLRRRETLAQQIAASEAREAEAVAAADKAAQAAVDDAKAASTGATSEVARLQRAQADTARRIATAEALVVGRPEVEAALAEAATIEAALAAAREALAGVEAQAEARRQAQGVVTELESLVREASTEGRSLVAACDALRARAGLVDAVPCQGTDLQGRCSLLAEAVTARDSLPAQEADLAARRAAHAAAVARRNEAAAARDALPEPNVAAERQNVATLETRARAAVAAGARLAQIEAAEAQLADDRPALSAIAADLVRAGNRVTSAAARLTEATEARATAIASVRTAFKTDREILKAELAALPPVDGTELAAAEQAATDAETALAALDAKLTETQATVATLKERIRGLEREAEDLAGDVARAARLESEIAQWVLLGKALSTDGIVALCIDDAGPTLSSIANDLLEACYGPRFSVAIETQRETRDGTAKETFDIRVLDAERDEAKSLALVSGGERVYINEAMTRALALYQAQASGRRYGCLFADESDGALDPEKKRQFSRMKRRVLEIGQYQREFFISHSAEVQEAADAVIDMAALTAA